MTSSIKSDGGVSQVSCQPTSSKGANFSSEEQSAPSDNGGLASVIDNRIHAMELIRTMANKIWRIFCIFCRCIEEGPPGPSVADEGPSGPSVIGAEGNKFEETRGNEIRGIINDINQQLKQIHQEESIIGIDSQSVVHSSRLLEFLSTEGKKETIGPGFNDFSGAMTASKEFLEIIGSASFVTAGFLVISYGLKRLQDVSDNKEECLSILTEMKDLTEKVRQCTEKENLKEAMEVDIRAAIELIMDGTMRCLSQITSSPFSKLLKTHGNKDELDKIKEEINRKSNRIDFQLKMCINDTPFVKRRLSREYPKHAVGIEKSLDEVTELLECATDNNAVAVILHGFGGMGKTTLADAVFSRVDVQDVDGKECRYSHVQVQVHESTRHLIELQKQILEDLKGSKDIEEIRKLDDGRIKIDSMLEKVTAFIYIDNVSEEELRELLPQNCFVQAKKVRLLITARDLNVRKACQMTTPPKEYQMRGLSSADAMNLLEKKMLAAVPRNQVEKRQVYRIIERCDGIPKMLNLVAGELSSAKDKREVREVIEALENFDGEKFGTKLESYFFAYDKLPDKELFLDICSVFKGWDWDTVADIVGKEALETSESRGLVAKGTDGVVTVPDVIMEVARRKAEGLGISFIETSELMNFLQDDEKEKQLRYLRYTCAKDLNKLTKMPRNLKYLEIDGKFHRDDLDNFPKKLLYLSNLRILKLIHFPVLKDLPGVLGEQVTGLRELSLSDCKSFEQLPYSISKLKYLRVLKMDSCKSFKQLPNDFGSLKSLEILCINHCDSLEDLPHSFEDLSSLRVLNLSFCTALKRLPDGLGKITSLEILDVSHCEELDSFPESIQYLKSLLSIDASWCSKLKDLPNEFCPPSMTYLKLTRCTALEKLPGQFGQSNVLSLRVLKLKSCTNLKNLPVGFSKLKYLVHLDLSGCIELVELCENFGDLLSLTTLSLDSCKKLEKLPPNFHFPCSLQHLSLSNCEMLEGESMNSLVETKALQMVYIKNSSGLEKKWREMQEERNQWSFTVDIGQDLSPEQKESEWEALSPEFDRLLQNRQGEPFQLSKIPPDTILLVIFDGQSGFNQDFPWPLIEDTVDDIKINFEIIYVVKHFNKLPKIVADRISGHALDNTGTRLLLERAFFTLQVNGKNLWHQKMNKLFSISTEVMNKRQKDDRVEENGGKYLSRWTLLSDCQLEKLLLEKCGRYLWLKQLADKKKESNIQLLRELFVNGGEDISLLRNSREVELGELREETILLEIRPADASCDIRLQSLKNMYNKEREKERPNLEIISVPVGQLNIKMEEFSGDIPWLVLQNSWTITRTVKYFLIKSCQWDEKHAQLSESWYPSRFLKIQVNREVTTVPVLSMLDRWGPKAYPFSDEKIKELKEEEWNERQRMSSLEFLFKPLMSELKELREVMRQRKIICLLCDGKHPRKNRVRTQKFADCIEMAMKDVMDDIHFIYVPHYQENKKKMLTVTDSFKIPYFPMVEDSKKPKLQHLLSLEHWTAMRFWMRVSDLRKEIEGMDENGEKFLELKILLDSMYVTRLSMAVIDRDGEVLTIKGRQIVDIFDPDKKEAKRLTEDEARKLVGDMIKGDSKEERKEAALQLESCLF